MVFRKSLLSSSVALALVGTYSPAFAQDDEAVIEEIIVEGGIRGSLKASMDIKRDSMGVVDAISAEDIGKLNMDKEVLQYTRTVLRLAERGIIAVVQKKIGFCNYEYRAVKI